MESGSKSPPSSPRKGGGDSDETTAIDDWMLATIEGWVRSSGRPQDDVVERIMTAFDMEELRKAAARLRDGKWATVQFKVPDRGAADYSRKLATEVYKAIQSVQDQETPKVQFWVSAAELHKVPGAAFSDRLDEVGVTARLGGVDAKLEQVMERLKGAERLEETVKDLTRIVTSLQEKLKAQPVASTASYAEMARGRLPRVFQGPNGQERNRSVSTKRFRSAEADGERQGLAKQRKTIGGNVEIEQARFSREAHPAATGSALSQDLRGFRTNNGEYGEWQAPRKKKQVNIRKGNSTVQAEGGIAAPVSVFISRTSPNCTEDTVKEKLEQCATAMAADDESGSKLKGLKVEQILIKIPEGEERRSRCWKVTVSPECAEHMYKDEAYPAAWGWRKWNRGPRSLEQGSKTLELRPSQGHGGSQVLNGGA